MLKRAVFPLFEGLTLSKSESRMSGKQPLMLTHVPDICAEPASVRSERQPHTWNKRSKRHGASFARVAYSRQRPPPGRNNAFSQGVL